MTHQAKLADATMKGPVTWPRDLANRLAMTRRNVALLAAFLAMLSPSVSRATPVCPSVREAPLAEVPAALAPGTWLPADAFDTVGAEKNPLPSAVAAFLAQRLTVAKETIEVRGFAASSSQTDEVAVIFLVPSQGGFCVANVWRAVGAWRGAFRLSLSSMWRSKDGQRGLFLLELKSRLDSGASSRSQTVAVATDGQHFWKAFEADLSGLAFDPQPGTVALLGTGEPVFFDGSHFQARPAGGRGRLGTRDQPPVCPESGSPSLSGGESARLREESPLKRGQWIATDDVSLLYRNWDGDGSARVAFRKLFASGDKDMEVVAIAGGDDAALYFLALAPKGFCVLNSVYWAFGGNGTHFSDSHWWRSSDHKLAILSLDVDLDFHHGVAADDPRSASDNVALAISGLKVSNATDEQKAAAGLVSP